MCSIEAINLNQNPFQHLGILYIQPYWSCSSRLNTVSFQIINYLDWWMDGWTDRWTDGCWQGQGEPSDPTG